MTQTFINQIITNFSSFSMAAGLVNCLLYASKSILGRFSGKLATLYKRNYKEMTYI